MTANTNYIEFAHKSNEAADLLLDVKPLYANLKKLIGSFLTYIILFAFAIFLCAFFIWLRFYLTKLYKKQLLTLTKENYKELRLFYTELTPSVAKFKQVNLSNMNKLPFVPRLIFVQINKTVQLIINHYDDLAKNFLALDLDRQAPKESKFKLTTENELWENRVTPYPYLA